VGCGLWKFARRAGRDEFANRRLLENRTSEVTVATCHGISEHFLRAAGSHAATLSVLQRPD